MVKPELGTKRICPETGRKFYDLNRDPIVSPYTGQSYPRSYFESAAEARIVEEETEEEEVDTVLEKPEFVSLEEADGETKADDDLPDLGDDEVDIDDGDDDPFLAEEEDEDDDVIDILGGGTGSDEEEH